MTRKLKLNSRAGRKSKRGVETLFEDFLLPNLPLLNSDNDMPYIHNSPLCITILYILQPRVVLRDFHKETLLIFRRNHYYPGFCKEARNDQPARLSYILQDNNRNFNHAHAGQGGIDTTQSSGEIKPSFPVPVKSLWQCAGPILTVCAEKAHPVPVSVYMEWGGRVRKVEATDEWNRSK